MKEIDRLNVVNGDAVFGINKFADQTKEGNYFLYLSFL